MKTMLMFHRRLWWLYISIAVWVKWEPWFVDHSNLWRNVRSYVGLSVFTKVLKHRRFLSGTNVHFMDKCLCNKYFCCLPYNIGPTNICPWHEHLSTEIGIYGHMTVNYICNVVYNTGHSWTAVGLAAGGQGARLLLGDERTAPPNFSVFGFKCY